MRAPRFAVVMLALMLPVFQSDELAAAAAEGLYALRQGDYPLEDPVLGVHGYWFEPPAGRAAAGQLHQYVVRAAALTMRPATERHGAP